MVLKRSKPLTRKTPLRRATIKAAKSQSHKARSGNKKTLPQLVDAADKVFSRYVRLRDSLWNGAQWRAECISCDRRVVVAWYEDGKWRWARGVDAGHYIGRSKKVVRWDEVNVNLQCARCNKFDDQVSVLQRYRKNLCLKCGDDAVEDVELRANTLHKPTRDELNEIIKTYGEWVKFTLAHPGGIDA